MFIHKKIEDQDPENIPVEERVTEYLNALEKELSGKSQIIVDFSVVGVYPGVGGRRPYQLVYVQIENETYQ